jgi:hypothetical protein
MTAQRVSHRISSCTLLDRFCDVSSVGSHTAAIPRKREAMVSLAGDLSAYREVFALHRPSPATTKGACWRAMDGSFVGGMWL